MGSWDDEEEEIVLLHNRGLREVPIEKSTRLRHLNVAFNRLRELELACPNLEYLDVSHNVLRRLQVESPKLRRLFAHANRLEDLGSSVVGLELRELWLNGNELSQASDLLQLRGMQLTVLRLAPNVVCESVNRYRMLVLSLLPRLAHLDDLAVSDEERSAASNMMTTVDGKIQLHQLQADQVRKSRQQHHHQQKKTTAEDDNTDKKPEKAGRKKKQETKKKKVPLLPEEAPVPPPPSSPPPPPPTPELADVIQGLASLSKPPAPAPRRRKKSPSKRKEQGIFETVSVDYEDGGVAIRAPGDGSVVVRYPKGGIAIASDSGCLRGFHPGGVLAVVCDSAGAVTVAGPDGSTALSVTPAGAGFVSFQGDDRHWTTKDHAPQTPFTFDWATATKKHPALSPKKSRPTTKPSSLGISVDPRASVVEAYFSHSGIKCVVPQQGGLRLLPEATDLFGQPLSSEDQKAAAIPATSPKKAIIPLSHSELIARIRESTASLPFS